MHLVHTFSKRKALSLKAVHSGTWLKSRGSRTQTDVISAIRNSGPGTGLTSRNQ